jgi:hydrogenase maturation protease
LRAIIGYGNTLRGEDGFGVDVIELLQTHSLQNTKLISAFCLTPELVLELLDADTIIFVDACYDTQNPYVLACSLHQDSSKLSHHIVPQMILSLLKEVYKKEPAFEIFSMLTCNFEMIKAKERYETSVAKIAKFLRDERI